MGKFEAINSALLARIPNDELCRVFEADELVDIDREFLGFVEQYDALAGIIPKHFTVVDLGCAYAPQAYLFEDNAKYIGVDVHTGARFSAANTEHYEMSIADFIERFVPSLDLNETFAICSYVPPWHGGSRNLARKAFPNVFSFYPSNKAESRALTKSMPPAARTKEDTQTSQGEGQQ